MRDGMHIVDDAPARMRWRPGEETTRESAHFCTLGCRSVTAADPSQAATLTDVVVETLTAQSSKPQPRRRRRLARETRSTKALSERKLLVTSGLFSRNLNV